VNEYGRDISVVVPSGGFQPSCLRGDVRTLTRHKTLKVVFNKAMVDSQLVCYPFGYDCVVN
jgi:hypothetical protein